MERARIEIWETIRDAFRAILGDAGFIARLSLVFLLLHLVLWTLLLFILLPAVEAPEAAGAAFRSVLAGVLAAAGQAVPSAWFIASFLPAVTKTEGAKRVMVWSPTHGAVLWRVIALHLLVAIGFGMLVVAGFYAGFGPEGSPFVAIALAAAAALATLGLALRLTPTVAAAALGRPMGLAEAWRLLDGQFLRFVVAFLGVYIPLTLLAGAIWFAIVAVSVVFGAHMMFFLTPIRVALTALAATLALSTVLAVVWPKIAPQETPSP